MNPLTADKQTTIRPLNNSSARCNGTPIKRALLAVFSTACLCHPVLHAEEQGDFTYSIEKNYSAAGTVVITKYTGESSEVTIPEMIAGLPVNRLQSGMLTSKKVTKLTIPKSVTIIGDEHATFDNNISEFIVMSDNPFYQSVDGVLFRKKNKNGLSLVRYPRGKSVDHYVVPDNTTCIENFAFMGCNCRNIAIPASVSSLEPSALCFFFTESISVDKSNPTYQSIDGVLFNKDGTSLVKYPLLKTDKSYVIPLAVTAIEDFAFRACQNTISISISKRVTRIATLAFDNYKGISINVDDENPVYRSVDGVLFDKDGNLLHYPRLKPGPFSIPDDITVIKDQEFWLCTGLTSVTIPKSVASIGYGAFQACEKLRTITFLGDAPSKVHDRSFAGNSPDLTIHYYKGATGFVTPKWKGCKTVEIDPATETRLDE